MPCAWPVRLTAIASRQSPKAKVRATTAPTRATAAQDRIAELIATRDQPKGNTDRALAHVVKIGPAIMPARLRTFATALRNKPQNGDGMLARNQIWTIAPRVEMIRAVFDRSEPLVPFVLSDVEARAASAVARDMSFDFAQDEQIRWIGNRSRL